MNSFLPASIGNAGDPGHVRRHHPVNTNFGGSLAAFLVQKIFFTIAGTFVFLYMFSSVPGAFDLIYGRLTDKPVATIGVVVGVAFLIGFLARLFWRHAKQLWEQAKGGGVILSRPRQYLKWVFFPSPSSSSAGREASRSLAHSYTEARAKVAERKSRRRPQQGT
jgi:hypothetical protein